ncbi:FG-GAP-like repeat-containing protein [Hymenobacter sp. M29]|uniref:FG-GAP-like repeat-containing protein n=1 Tax=Hymenobacter mellowenesis TaxID=3063995 RepID=A0ABT9AEQ2_9BACT|nr:FG-GAP-like repeat-containing protein [Hymenobacter sp. M29]MDO7847162.1 FG-GAP-like repeat-containing protein [Hymenobacter sp. M29]
MPHFSPSTHLRRTYSLATLGLLLATAGRAQAQTPASFAPASTYPTGLNTFPYNVAVADMNGDGRPDIVTVNSGGGSVGVLLGRAGGGFFPINTYLTGGDLSAGLAVADVNSDGRLDIVATNRLTNNVGVLLGLAGGGLALASTYLTGINASTSPNGLAVADVNGDGRPDIVAANTGNGSAGVLLGLASGSFAPFSFHLTSAYPKSVAVADMDGDGRADIVTNHDGSVGILLGLAGGGFGPVSPYPTIGTTRPNGLAVADVNGDGRPDIVTTSTDRNTVGVLLGQAGGSLAPIRTYSTGPGSSPDGVAVADVNGDGLLDLVTANAGTETAGILLGQTAGGFAAVSTYAAGTTGGGLTLYGVSVADINGDGRPDIVTANFGSSTVGVLLNTGTFTPLAAASATAAAEVTLFPNPARDGFTVQLPAAWGAAPVRAELLNALGQVVRAQATAPPVGASLAFATAGLAPGVYVLRVQAGGHALARRVVVE